MKPHRKYFNISGWHFCSSSVIIITKSLIRADRRQVPVGKPAGEPSAWWCELEQNLLVSGTRFDRFRRRGFRRRGYRPDGVFHIYGNGRGPCHPATAWLLAPPRPAGGARREAKGAPARGRGSGSAVAAFHLATGSTGKRVRRFGQNVKVGAPGVGSGRQPFCKYLLGSGSAGSALCLWNKATSHKGKEKNVQSCFRAGLF